MTLHALDLTPPVGDAVKTTTCYMCACRCGIKVHLKNGEIRYIEGNRDHPVNRGVLCAKGSAGIMNHYSPARLRKPLKRVGARGDAEFEEIEWDEALTLATTWLSEVRYRDPRKLAFFTGRDQSQALTGWWAAQFGTCNYAAHGGFCSVNMAAAGMYTISGSFWEFGEPDWEHTKYFMMFGVAEDHDSNPIKMGLAEVKRNGAKFVSVNPVRTGYSAIADEWLGIKPGTDGLLIMALIHELLRAGKVDAAYLKRYTNAGWLVISDPGAADDGLFARDADGKILCFDAKSQSLQPATEGEPDPALKGEVTLGDGRKATPAFELLARRYLEPDYAPDNVADRCGIPAKTIKRLAFEIAQAAFESEVTIHEPWVDWTGKAHDSVTGRPVSFHAMRGISAHANGFHTCRALHILQILLGTIDVPGGFRYKAPYPKTVPPAPKPSGHPEQIAAGTVMPGAPLGFPHGPDDLLVDPDGSPRRIDKAFSWDAPMSAHGMMHSVITNAWKGDPYSVDVLFMYMANMAWNSAMNTEQTIRMLTDKDDAGNYKIPKIIYSDAYFSEMVAYADLILPDTTYLERHDCISLLDRPICSADSVADSIRQPVVPPDRDVRPFQDVLIDLGHRLGLPGLTNSDGTAKHPGGYADYMANHERKPGVGSLIGFRGEAGDKIGRGEPNPDQVQRYIENGCFFEYEFEAGQRYMKHANRDYLATATDIGLIDAPNPVFLQLYSEHMQRFRLAARGHGAKQPPAEKRERVETYFDPLPIWYEPFDQAAVDSSAYPLHAITQRPMAMYHSWHSQNAWLRQIHGQNRIYVQSQTGANLGIKDDDWIEIESRHGVVTAQVRLMQGVNPDTIWTWNAIGKRKGAWNLETGAPEAERGFLLNHLIDDLLPPDKNGYAYANADPVTGQAAWFDLKVTIRKAADQSNRQPSFKPLKLKGLKRAPSELRYGEAFDEAAQ